jgi:hypothetical protein
LPILLTVISGAPGIAGMVFAVPVTLPVRITFPYSGELPRITGLLERTGSVGNEWTGPDRVLT